ncbi:hypothetical protein BFW38_02620 [Terasakiispira papahanaumokuakeensis]|uniref:Uncharacterized protein n=1 Tax=Terasakiispira papahanaumokuakeensis TaxID=197479 RepID=A0A1E2V6X7_9GAMM|nr:hypothetical protein [Terasakiispira papahanaumokuakeensis]ODC02606.1 hypothetical protein BFW38_02620 [Terasakiispira papahanaumokuakeensis]
MSTDDKSTLTLSALSPLMNQALQQSATLTRYAATDPTEAVMTTNGCVTTIDKGTTSWYFNPDQVTPLVPVSPSQSPTPYVDVQAQWLNTQQALEQNIRVEHGGSANTFGGVGTLLVPPAFQIPTVMATPETVRHYGLTLIDRDEVLACESRDYEIVMMRYTYTPEYKKDFLMQPQGGGGIFVETHNFPHIHIPLNEQCGGYIVIGKRLSDGNTYHFTAFQIPYGKALYTPAYTIHGDGTLVGEYGITVADSAFVQADTVLIYNQKTKTMAHHVVPDWPNNQDDFENKEGQSHG